MTGVTNHFKSGGVVNTQWDISQQQNKYIKITAKKNMSTFKYLVYQLYMNIYFTKLRNKTFRLH